jgi:hypothetical protein
MEARTPYEIPCFPLYTRPGAARFNPFSAARRTQHFQLQPPLRIPPRSTPYAFKNWTKLDAEPKREGDPAKLDET